MKFLVYCPVADAELADRMGTADYSYHFVMSGYLPVLEQLGEVVRITDPSAEVDPLFAQASATGERCVLLAFCPPHRAPLGLACPTITVVAWEFASIPSQGWDDEPRNDWRTVYADHGRAIVLSTDTRAVVREAMGDAYPVAAIPVPVFDRVTAPPQPTAHNPDHRIRVRGRIIDSRDLQISPDSLRHADPMVFATQVWDGQSAVLRFAQHEEGTGCLVGFYEPEVWGTWSRIAEPWVLLPFAVGGRVRVSFEATAYGSNVGREITVEVGDSTHRVRLEAGPKRYRITANLATPTNVVRFVGLDTSVHTGATDIRTMGIGLMTLSVTRGGLLRRRAGVAPQPLSTERILHLDGIVYTSVLNPEDGRKNWADMVTAFCAAFKDDPDATLVLKMTHRSVAAYFGRLQFLLQRIGPTACRVVAAHGFLPDQDYADLMAASTYYLNTSHGEGLCLPMMEFMSAGVPVVAPHHTAMQDYLSAANSFAVAAHRQPTVWPNDPAARVRTSYWRLDWADLVRQLRASRDLVLTDRRAYDAMAVAARATQAEFSSDARVASSLSQFLAEVSDE